MDEKNDDLKVVKDENGNDIEASDVETSTTTGGDSQPLELAVTEINQSITDILIESSDSTSTIEISEEESNHLLYLAMMEDDASQRESLNDMGDGSNYIMNEDLGWEHIEQMLADVNQEIAELKQKVSELHLKLEEQMTEIENEKNASASIAPDGQDKQIE